MPGLVDGALEPPPKSPNCVTSVADPTDEEHHMPAWAFDGDLEATKAKLKGIVSEMPRARLHAEDDHYLHFVFTTRLFRWKDDVEFHLDPQEGKVHFRSASRTGYSDLGLNRKRMNAIMEAFHQ